MKYCCIVDTGATGYIEFLHSQWPSENIPVLEMSGGEQCKDIPHAMKVWEFLTKHKATRATTLICLGGGAVTDLGGFCASTFKRGIPHINVPTTLLAAVDAAIGGKTGIDFMGLKNQIGTFSQPREVIIHPSFFNSLPPREILSGYGEALKTALLCDDVVLLQRVMSIGSDVMGNKKVLFDSILPLAEVKKTVVRKDPEERDFRRILNLGHTIGHAFESLMAEHEHPISHGHAVMAGMVAESVLSHQILGLESNMVSYLADIMRCNYPAFTFTCTDYPRLTELMFQDKKNRKEGAISFSLLRAPGDCVPGVDVEKTEVEAALDIFRDLAGI